MKWKQLALSIIVLFIAVYISLATAYAQVASSSSQSLAPSQVDYQLPYPGLLPDNPLYFLKMIRDNLTAFFVGKPLDRAQLDLLQSDKDVQSGYLLVTQEVGKGDLALKTFSQGQDYFAQAIEQSSAAQKQGYSITEFSKKLELANEKHEQILQVVTQHSGQNGPSVAKSEHSRIQTFTKEIKALH